MSAILEKKMHCIINFNTNTIPYQAENANLKILCHKLSDPLKLNKLIITQMQSANNQILIGCFRWTTMPSALCGTFYRSNFALMSKMHFSMMILKAQEPKVYTLTIGNVFSFLHLEYLFYFIGKFDGEHKEIA